MQWTPGMLVALHWNNEDGHVVFEMISYHPDGVVLEDEDGNYAALTMQDFHGRSPFPAGIVRRGWFGRKQWVYGTEKPHPPKTLPIELFVVLAVVGLAGVAITGRPKSSIDEQRIANLEHQAVSRRNYDDRQIGWSRQIYAFLLDVHQKKIPAVEAKVRQLQRQVDRLEQKASEEAPEDLRT